MSIPLEPVTEEEFQAALTEEFRRVAEMILELYPWMGKTDEA